MSRKYFFLSGFKKEDEEDEVGKNRKRRREHRTFGFAAGKSSASESNSGSSSYSSINNYSYRKLETQPVVDKDNVICTDKGFFEIAHSDAWGSAFIPVENPNSLPITYDEIHSIKLIDNFPKIPALLWSRWIQLVFYFCEQTKNKPTIIREWNTQKATYDYYRVVNNVRHAVEHPLRELTNQELYNSPIASYGGYLPPPSSSTAELEVTALLCRKIDDLTQWKIVIPKQVVSRASVFAEISRTIDIETGEIYEIFPPTGYVHAGSTHSHNTMEAFFSSTDDKSELGVPGLHIVVGRVNQERRTYEFKASIVLRKQRKDVAFRDVVDHTPVPGVTYHTNVLEHIKTETTKVYNNNANASSDFGWLYEKSVSVGSTPTLNASIIDHEAAIPDTEKYPLTRKDHLEKPTDPPWLRHFYDDGANDGEIIWQPQTKTLHREVEGVVPENKPPFQSPSKNHHSLHENDSPFEDPVAFEEGDDWWPPWCGI